MMKTCYDASCPRAGRARKEATSGLTEVLAANADIHWEAGAQLQVASLKPRTLLGTTDRDRSTGHRFYSDGTHLSEQGMVELVAALKMDVLEARMMHGSSRRLPKAAAQGCDADLIISDSSLCAVSAKASVHSNVGTGA